MVHALAGEAVRPGPALVLRLPVDAFPPADPPQPDHIGRRPDQKTQRRIEAKHRRQAHHNTRAEDRACHG